ncbi:MAG: acetyl-CoA carboxylase biotin carboxyl carrier protein subunit [Planctomycetota bacterium]|nr:acetyl-CoA carboxylase biotin carboxyl carrier protein subunit [Planctomycetota bacterium]
MSRVEVKSDVTGTVWKIEMSVGDAVGEGDEIMILESMKMEIPAMAPEAGKIVEITVSENESVEEGQVLAVIEA